jgi:hypothetical protein
MGRIKSFSCGGTGGEFEAGTDRGRSAPVSLGPLSAFLPKPRCPSPARGEVFGGPVFPTSPLAGEVACTAGG